MFAPMADENACKCLTNIKKSTTLGVIGASVFASFKV